MLENSRANVKKCTWCPNSYLMLLHPRANISKCTRRILYVSRGHCIILKSFIRHRFNYQSSSIYLFDLITTYTYQVYNTQIKSLYIIKFVLNHYSILTYIKFNLSTMSIIFNHEITLKVQQI